MSVPTCARDKPLETSGLSRGRTLAQAVQSLYGGQPLTGFVIRQVHCLNGCLNPCNAAFRGHGKYSLRFNRLSAVDAPALLEFAARYLGRWRWRRGGVRLAPGAARQAQRADTAATGAGRAARQSGESS